MGLLSLKKLNFIMIPRLYLNYLIFGVLLIMLPKVSFQQTVAINEVVASNATTIADEDGDYPDWIELYNYGTSPVNLGGFGLSDNEDQPFKWTLPSVILQPNQFLIVWASGKNRITIGQPLHTNYSISSSGEPIILTRFDGELISNAPSVELVSDVSIGRQPDGTGDWLFFLEPTPGEPNTGVGIEELIAPPTFSHESGYFNTPFELTISHSNPDAIIIYTTDGSEPDIENLEGTVYEYKNEYPIQTNAEPFPALIDSFISKQYDGSFFMQDPSGFQDKFTHKNTRQHIQHIPENPVRKLNIIKARAYVNGFPSQVVARNYFVWPLGNPYDLPVISIQTQENYMFDYENGVYTAGIDFDTWRANSPNNNQYWRSNWNNYWRRGAEWEYPCHVEIFEPINFDKILSTGAGWRIHGNNSRNRVLKNLRLYARGMYGQNIFVYNPFEQPIFDAPNQNSDRYNRMLLRGDGSGGSIAYDVVMNRLLPEVYNGVSRIRPAIHFINGEYWGLTSIRDRMDVHHYELNFGIDRNNFAQIDCKGSNCATNSGTSADNSDYSSLRNYIRDNDMVDQAHFDSVEKRLDMTSFIDHMVLQIYSADDSYERYFWKARTPVNDGYGDGRWRVSTQDFEASLKTNTNWVEYMANTSSSSNESIHGNLIANDGYKNNFLTRFADMLNSTMASHRVVQLVNRTFEEVEPYIADDLHRSPRSDFYTNSDKQNLLGFADARPNQVREELAEFFGIEAIVDITVEISDNEAGEIKWNTINLDSSIPGIPESPFPWVGKYFEGIPITATAKANPGYTFSHWSGDVSSTDATITFTPNGNMEVKANFDPIVYDKELIYFWLLDGEIPNNTPLERLDATYAVNNLEAAITYSSCLDGYPFNESHVNWRKASMERRNAPTPINYRPVANNQLPYDGSEMRGIQIRQPFRNDNLENVMVLEFPTTGYRNIELTLAIESDGAAQSLLIDYWNGSSWSTSELEQSTFLIGSSYALISCDFSEVEEANDNEEFQIRLRFDGENMFSDDGLRAHFNNIAIEGEKLLSTTKINKVDVFKAYPNPTNSKFVIESSEPVQSFYIYNIYGQLVEVLNPKSTLFEVDLSRQPKGIYVCRSNWEGHSETIRIIKQ